MFESDVVFADDDGIIVITSADAKNIFQEASKIFKTQEKQIDKMVNGLSLRKQLFFDDYQMMKKMKKNYTFNEHIKQLGLSSYSKNL